MPRNFTNRREHWAKAWQEKQTWWANVAFLGGHMRKQAGWPKAEPGDERQVLITCYRVHAMDDDNNTISVKSCRDALQVKTGGKSVPVGDKRFAVAKLGAGLIYSDGDPAVTIRVLQLPVAHFKEQKVVIVVERPDV